MKTKMLASLRFILPVVVLVLFGIQLAWDYNHGGVLKHYLLHDPNLPGFSNWWGLISLPVITFFLLDRILRRIRKKGWQLVPYESRLLFIGGLLIASTFSIGFNQEWAYLHYFAMSLIVLSLLIPLYKSEFLLGFILGMAFTFGAVLPLIIGAVYAIIFAFCYLVIRKGFIWLLFQTKKVETK